MTTDFQQVRAIFLAALERPPEARDAYVAEATAGADAALREQVEVLLRAHRAGGPLGDATGPVAPSVAPGGHPHRDERAGTLVAGRYKLVERVGEGGMGSVWVAQQSEPVKRKVAVKLIKAGMDSRQVLARFEAERQALAVMDHPNIAKVLDGGLTPDGRPFFVMELVKGTPITEYCDARKLTPRERLELFIPVCQAIQHAHQKGIIHRDIKPSNVLVALYDDRPVPKVIDFGVAKATGGALTEHTLETAFGGVVGTPQYMSPEQASLNNLDVDTRSDVYSLGVLLYELLTGSPPFARADLEKRGLLEILRVVREDEPPRPSTRLSTADALPSLSASRGTDPKKLTGLLRNELDWIVMRALEKDRTRRYETANGLAADLNRYLSGEAVRAHPPGAAYRVQKFVRRHRGQVVAAGFVLFALLAGMAGTIAGLIEAKRQERHAVAARRAESERAEGERLARLDAQANAKLAGERLAQVEAERKKAETAKVEAQAREAEANAVEKFFQTTVFAAARPKGQDGGLGRDVSLRAAITAALPALAGGFADQPLVEARLRQAVGITFSYLAEREHARDQFERARALLTEHRGPDHPATLNCMNNLANSYDTLNRKPDALKLREEVLAIQKRVLPPDHPDTLVSMSNLALSYDTLNRKVDAFKLNEEVLAIRKRVLPPDHRDTLISMSNLANSYQDLDRPADALRLREEVLAIQKRVLPPDHPDTLFSMNNLANSYALDRPADAVKLLEEVLVAQKRVLPPDHPDTLRSMVMLAVSLIKNDRAFEAIPLLDEFLDRAGTNPAMNPEVIPLALSLCWMYVQRAGDPAGCRATAGLWEKLNPTDAASLYNVACFRAVTAGMQAKAPGLDAAALAKDDSDLAMRWLHQAVQAGYKDAAHMKKDPDLDPLRGREDFQALLASLTAKEPVAPPREGE